MDATHTDETLLQAWRAGDRRAGDALMRRYYAAVLRFFELKCAHVADDLTQRTFLACATAGERFRGDAGFRAYLFGIARIKLLEQTRAARRRPVRIGDEPAARDLTGLTTLVARRREHLLLLQALAALEADALIPLQLYYWEGLRTNEIAAVLDIPRSTVTSRLHRARQALRESLARLQQPGAAAAAPDDDELAAWARALVNPDVVAPDRLDG